MVTRPTPLELYKLIDKSNCGNCHRETCLAFITDLLNRIVSLDACTHLRRQEQRENYYQIKTRILPPQRQITFGIGSRMCRIGGEEVFYRHELTYFNPTALIVEIHDALPNALDMVDYLTKLTITRIGDNLRIDGLALRCISGDANIFGAFVLSVSARTDLPLILCSWDSDILAGAVYKIPGKRPLLYAANDTNWEQVGKLASDLDLPVVIFAPSIEKLTQLICRLVDLGVNDLVLDTGIFFGTGFISMGYNLVQEIRSQVFYNTVQTLGYPLIGVPAAYWAQQPPLSKKFPLINEITENKEEKDGRTDLWVGQYQEVLMGTILEALDVNLIVLHTGRTPEEVWALLALMTFRQNLFTDPRIYPRVDSGLTIVGTPDLWSPIFVTSNYRMTKIPVEQDLTDNGINCYLVVVDTDGIGIESATAGGQFNEERIKNTLDQTKVLEKVNHKVVILPGMAARLKAPLEELANIEVWIGPRDSSGISAFLKEKWDVESLQKKYTK